MLKLDAFTKKFDKTIGLNQVILSIDRGSIHGLIGKNGAGKTTLLKSVMGIYKGDSGSIHWEDHTTYENLKAKGCFYFIPDFPFYTSSESLGDLAQLHRNLYPNWSEERYQKLIAGLNLNPKWIVKQKSKGVQCQIAFCLGLSTMPKLLLLDEPFDGLDPVIRHQIKNLLIQDVAERQLSVLVSSHNLRELDDLCDTVTLIQKGEIQFSGELDQLKSNIFKVQIAFNGICPDLESSLDVIFKEQQGNLYTFVIRCDRNAITQYLEGFKPKFLEIQPLSLEALFIYEMEGLNYECKNIIL